MMRSHRWHTPGARRMAGSGRSRRSSSRLTHELDGDRARQNPAQVENPHTGKRSGNGGHSFLYVAFSKTSLSGEPSIQQSRRSLMFFLTPRKQPLMLRGQQGQRTSESRKSISYTELGVRSEAFTRPVSNTAAGSGARDGDAACSTAPPLGSAGRRRVMDDHASRFEESQDAQG